MKKILFALGMVCLCSCNTLQKEDAAVSDSTVAVSEEVKEVGVCSVEMTTSDNATSKIKLDSIIIKNANDSTIGIGYYIGNYSVPHNGTMTIYWKSNYSSGVSAAKRWSYRNKYKLKIGNANLLKVYVGLWHLEVGNVWVYENPNS